MTLCALSARARLSSGPTGALEPKDALSAAAGGANARRVSLRDWERSASAKLASRPDVLAYFMGGAGEEETLRRNEAQWQRTLLLPRVLLGAGGAGAATLATTLLGRRVAAPFGVAPVAYHMLLHPDGELATARAAAAAGIGYCVSSFASRRFDAIAAAAAAVAAVDPPVLLMQVYIMRDREVTRRFVQRVAASGAYAALVLTVDRPVLGRRHAAMRADFAVDWEQYGDPNELAGTSKRSRHSAYDSDVLDSLSWADVAWLRSLTSLPLVLKGVLAPDDAAHAVRAGAAGVWVSNHGGRQLDASLATAEALPAVVAAVRGAEAAAGLVPHAVAVWVDGGVRRGTDIAKALAKGADFVWVGRPAIWGLAVDGEPGVAEILATLADELRNAMQLLGVRAAAELTSRHIVDDGHVDAQLRLLASGGSAEV